ncbi:hypothetical protein BO78DRAFT_398139 [Aspergillus sclerotiicarbonarius CBS 121057]|uniref:Uncharacterized protein n=1 Tax=Aspergillus sclerotiicarbonarius (strain CBS 121057 / IBT 28362) TaxID=1448318 RepID=A0A319E5N0_ASPSB|nr:hypothetical protein BO78DRAFT_398139 [Aspergillus sclerotiicarbonarius CBS 121057]
MDPFQRLPAEIIQQIIYYIPDFVGLESLLLVSERVQAIFQYDPCLVGLEDLLASTYISTMPDIPRKFHQVARIHSQSIGYGTDGDDIDSTSENYHMSSATLLQMIQIAAQIQRLACACLFTMRRNFCNAVETHLALSINNKDFAAPPSWIEEYRTYWALWHLRHYSDLQKPALDHLSFDDCTTMVQNPDTYAAWNGLTSNESLIPRVEEIWAVAAVLADLGLHVSYGSLRHHQQDEPPEALWDVPQGTPMPLISSFKLPLQALGYPVWCPPPVPDATVINDVWDRIVQASSIPSLVSMFFRTQVYDILIARRRTAKCMQDMRPYRRLGTFIWDAWRVYSAGLMLFRVGKIPTPYGGFIEPSGPGLDKVRMMQTRWAALIGKDL